MLASLTQHHALGLAGLDGRVGAMGFSTGGHLCTAASRADTPPGARLDFQLPVPSHYFAELSRVRSAVSLLSICCPLKQQWNKQEKAVCGPAGPWNLG